MEKRIKDLTTLSNIDIVVSIPIDSTNFNKAMNVETTTLLKTTIDDADITNDYQLVTPTAIYNRYASESKTGCIKLYSDIPIGFEISFKAYSAFILFFSLQSKIPILALSSSDFIKSSTADK